MKNTPQRKRMAQLERCVHAVARWIREQEDRFASHGADRLDNENYRALLRLRRRVWRTLTLNNP